MLAAGGAVKPGKDGACEPRRTTIFLASAIRVAALVIAISLVKGAHFTLFQFQAQDRPVLLGLIVLLLGLHLVPGVKMRGGPWPGDRALIALLAVLAAGLTLMTHVLMRDFGVSYDEFMVQFDMQVYERWQLAAPFAAEWRDYTLNLVPSFLLNQVQPEGLASTYLPLNAVLRLGFSQLHAVSLMNPLLALVGGVALLDIAKNQFGEDRETIFVVVLLYLFSMQLWAAAMTPYAMTAHLALNLVWLAAFLRGGRWHVLAIAAGAVATGLHQLVFHPLFVAPFLLQRLFAKQWRLVAAYAGAYAIICLGWIAFPMIASTYTGIAPVAGGSHGNFLRDRVLPLFASRDPYTLLLMMMNVLRFVAWQHLALVPLATLSIVAVRRNEGLSRPLVGGIVLVLLLLALILPFQGHGWGYRYWHGWIGSFALLGGFGYRRLRGFGEVRARSVVAIATVATVPAMGWLAYCINAFVAPHVMLDRQIAAIDADMVLIETESATATRDGRWAPNAIDLVRNRPDLSNRPLRLSSQLMLPDAAARLCARGSIAMIDRSAQRRLGFAPNQLDTSPEFMRLRARLLAESRAGRCRLIP